MVEVSFHEVTKVFPNGTTAVDALTCTIAKSGEAVARPEPLASRQLAGS